MPGVVCDRLNEVSCTWGSTNGYSQFAILLCFLQLEPGLEEHRSVQVAASILSGFGLLNKVLDMDPCGSGQDSLSH